MTHLGTPLYHLDDAQFSVVARMRDEGGVLPRMVERIRYSVYGEPTVFPYSFADCADTSSGDGPDGYITTHDQTQFNAWYGATPKDIRADVADDGSVVPMDLGSNTGVYDNLGLGDQNAFNGEYGANGGLFPVEGAASLVPGFWSNGGATGATGPTDSPVSDIGYCGYAWNPGSQQYAVRFRNYDPGLGRWLQRDPAGYVDGCNVMQYCRADPGGLMDADGRHPVFWVLLRLPPLVLPFLRGDESVLPAFFRVETSAGGSGAWMYWESEFSRVERARIMSAIQQAKARAAALANEASIAKSRLKPCVVGIVGKEIDDFIQRMNDLVEYLENPKSVVKLYQLDKDGADFADTKGLRYGPLSIIWYNAYTELNTIKGADWRKKNDDQLKRLFLHELGHIVEGGTNHDGDDSLLDLQALEGRAALPFEKWTKFVKMVQDAEASPACKACQESSDGKNQAPADTTKPSSPRP